MDAQRKSKLLEYLVSYLEKEQQALGLAPLGDDYKGAGEPWSDFRALVNTRPPVEAPADFLAAQGELLSGLIAEAGITKVEDIDPCQNDARIRLWRGDITTLAADAIVNAANAKMLGCWVPGHHCIDNAIHTFSGVELRLECDRIMRAQGHDEPTAQAKITPAYNLPARYVIHTVGPIAKGMPSDAHRAQLAQCYSACLDCAKEAGCASIAFCCISTGVFGFPKREAAEIAVRSVRSWLDEHNDGINVVFNVFGEEDEAIYRSILD